MSAGIGRPLVVTPSVRRQASAWSAPDRMTIDPLTGCAELTRHVARSGVTVDGTQVALERVLFAAQNGDLPAGARVVRVCDNPRCKSPDHRVLDLSWVQGAG